MEKNNHKIGSVLIIGGGIAGIQASLDLANSGYKVYLLENSPAIGGTMAQLDKTFPTNDCAMCIMAPKLVECGRHPNIELLTCSEIEEVSGKPGNFNVRVFKHPRFIDLDKCTGCGECEKVCPIEAVSEFNEGLVERKAVYRPFAQAYPNAFAIDKKQRPPCQQACPAGVHVQGYIALIKEKKYKEAYDLIRENNPFPSVCGRICTHPCEQNCRRGEYDSPVAIKDLKRFIADYVIQHKDEFEGREQACLFPTEPKKEKVAIIGSGPSGLTAGYFLAKMGYRVTVFEELPVPGGMLAVGIPEYRLPKDILDYEIKAIEKAGVEIRTNTCVDSIGRLKQEGYDAIYIATGAHIGVKPDIPGCDGIGVVDAVDFLRSVNLGKKVELGKKVAVVGGGNTAIDAARTAKRMGCEVTLLYRRTKVEMPAEDREVENALEEGVDTIFLVNPSEIVCENGRVKCIKCTKMKLGELDASGRRRPVPIEGSDFLIERDALIYAITQKPNISFISGNKNIEVTRWGTIKANKKTFETDESGIFAGGDVESGPATVIEAIATGRKTAISIDRYIRGEDLKEGRELEIDELPPKQFPEFVERKERQIILTLAVEERIKNFEEVDLGFTEEMAVEEAKRCLECGLCSECMECVRVCEADAVSHSMVGEHLNIDVGSIILAPGLDKFDPSMKYEFGYKKYPNVVTSIQFERILAPSGPYQGHILRPSDSKEPKRIAWIQCVGSRDEESNSTYCSSVCCMYAIKEAIITQEHVKDIESSIFFMDIRAYGKDFDKYYERAEQEYGVRFIRSRVGKIEEVEDSNNLLVYYTTEDGKQLADEFDLVVLSVGLKPSQKIADLSDKLGIRLNAHEFFRTSVFSPLQTTLPGIFVCGPASGPKDIPETVMEASGAVASAAELLSDVRGTEVIEKVYPPERDVNDEPPRIGVFVCHCGINIAGVVDVPQVVAYAKTLLDVVNVEDNLFTCAQDTIERMKQVIEEHNLNRVVVASCSPRTHEPLFQETLRESGLNSYLFEMANIRDQCSWVHMNEPEEATRKSKELVRMAVTKARLLESLPKIELPVIQKALVIGGGLAGMVSAFSIARQGFEVTLVEREQELGGNLRNLYYTTQGDDVQEYLNSLIEKVENHPRIKVYKGANIENIEGYIGNYKTSITTNHESRITNNELEHGIVIVSTGAEESKPKEYLYGEDARVITQLELGKRLVEAEKILEIKGKKPVSQIQKLKSVVMIQCVGSRDDEHPYCSRVCCQEAVKNALKLEELNPEVSIYILHRDVRTYGFFEKYYQKARDDGIIFIRYEKDEKPIVSRLSDFGELSRAVIGDRLSSKTKNQKPI